MASKPSRAKYWFLLHSWLALPFWGFAFFVCLTGTLAAVSQEINWLIDPAFRANPPTADAQPMGLARAGQAALQHAPQAELQWLMQQEDYTAIQAQVVYPDARATVFYINPYTGAIQGTAPTVSLRSFLRALHGWLLIPFKGGTSWGWFLVAALSLPMLGSLITGLVVYKKFWRGFFKFRIRITQGPRVAWGDFHRLAGVWSIWFLALIALTGLWFLVQAIQWSLAASAEEPPSPIMREHIPLVATGQAAPKLALPDLLQQVQAQMPLGFVPRYIGMPASAYDPVSVWGRNPRWPLFYDWASANPYSGQIMQSRHLDNRSKLEWATDSLRALHTGDFAGPVLKIIWASFGLLLTLMVLSGMLIWHQRTAQAAAAWRKKQQAQALLEAQP